MCEFRKSLARGAACDPSPAVGHFTFPNWCSGFRISPPPSVSTSGPELLPVTNYLILTTCKKSTRLSGGFGELSTRLSGKKSTRLSVEKFLGAVEDVRGLLGE